MTLHVDFLEAVWFLVTAAALLQTTLSLIDARRDLVVVTGDLDEGRDVRELTARGNVRREVMRIVMELLLLSIVLPGLFIDRPISLSLPLVALMLIPIALLIQVRLDGRLRGRLAVMLLTMVRSDRDRLALESSVQENIELTKEATANAEKAYHEANNVNVKIATLTEKLAQKEDKA